MSFKYIYFCAAIISFLLVCPGCSTQEQKTTRCEKIINIVATTTMLADLAQEVGQEHVTVVSLATPGVDPHLYQACAGDVELVRQADIVLYNGLHLEGKLEDIFENLRRFGTYVICLENHLDRSSLLMSQEDAGARDPHIWFDISIWKQAAHIVAQELAKIDPDNTHAYTTNLQKYLVELDNLDHYMRTRISEIPKEQRILVTSHDAFHYFAKAYGFDVHGIQGTNTHAEAGTADIRKLAEFIYKNRVKAIFAETSVSPRTIEALKAAVQSKGFHISIGGALYSDSLGAQGSGAENYILTMKANIDTIVDALK